jgi:hypothetical protein
MMVGSSQTGVKYAQAAAAMAADSGADNNLLDEIVWQTNSQDAAAARQNSGEREPLDAEDRLIKAI